jgi:uncharacterized repeat protein (TIGR03803 family)
MRFALFILMCHLGTLLHGGELEVVPKVLYHFDSSGGPFTGLVLGKDGFFYGTISSFESSRTNVPGTVFRLSRSGEYSIILSAQNFKPSGPLIQDQAGNFFGVTDFDNGANGTVYEITSAGELKRLVSFEGALNGARPYGRLLLASDGKLYGTTEFGGLNDSGSVFCLDANQILTTVHFFDSQEGAQALGGLIEPTTGQFYGATTANGEHIFTVTPSGQIRSLVPLGVTNGFGFVSMLLARDGNIYGTTGQGGQNWTVSDQGGVFFRMTLDGTYTNLASFSSSRSGEYPNGLVEAPDGDFYGTSQKGGQFGYGTAFKVTPSGQITLLASFDGQNGREPRGQLVYGTDGQLYGVTRLGGKNGTGTFFRLTDRPLLTIESDGTSLTLSWDSAPGQVYRVETNANLNGNAWALLRDGINSTEGKTSISLPQPSERTFFRIAFE